MKMENSYLLLNSQMVCESKWAYIARAKTHTHTHTQFQGTIPKKAISKAILINFLLILLNKFFSNDIYFFWMLMKLGSDGKTFMHEFFQIVNIFCYLIFAKKVQVKNDVLIDVTHSTQIFYSLPTESSWIVAKTQCVWTLNILEQERKIRFSARCNSDASLLSKSENSVMLKRRFTFKTG